MIKSVCIIVDPPPPSLKGETQRETQAKQHLRALARMYIPQLLNQGETSSNMVRDNRKSTECQHGGSIRRKPVRLASSEEQD
jgi:hypothetical protein